MAATIKTTEQCDKINDDSTEVASNLSIPRRCVVYAWMGRSGGKCRCEYVCVLQIRIERNGAAGGRRCHCGGW